MADDQMTGERLESWKEIAAYLKRDESTVRRWERAEGLPVRRHRHLARSSVYAYPGELDAWREGRRPGGVAPPGTGASRIARPASIAAALALTLLSAGGGRFVGPVAAAGPGDQLKETKLMPTGRAVDGMLTGGKVSPDGRYVSFADQFIAAAGGTGNLAIWDVKKDKTTVVNKFSNLKPWADGYAEDSTWSPDGKELAYAWTVEGGDKNQELRIVDRASGKHRVVYTSDPGVTWMTPLAWSPDGRYIATALGVGAGEATVGATQLALISVADSSVTTLKRFDGNMPGGGAFSPDGKFVAYDFQPSKTSTARDVFVIGIDGTHDTPIADDLSTNDVLLGWFSDGHLLYTSDRAGTVDAWTVQVTDGKPQGQPVVVKRDVGQLDAQGITRDGRVFVQKTELVREVYVVDVDPTTGKATRPPAPLMRAQPTVKRRLPAWSPDGARIAYVQSAPGVAESVVVQTIATGEIRVYPVPVRNLDWPVWQPDGQAFFFDGTGEDNVQQTFRLDLQSGLTKPFTSGFIFGFSRNGEYYYEGGPGVPERAIVRRGVADGSSTPVATRDEVGGGTQVSPDGGWLAYFTGGRWNRVLVIRPIGGGEPRVLTGDLGGGFQRLAWSPDSQFVFFDSPRSSGLGRVSIDGSEPQSVGIPRGGVAKGGLGAIKWRSMNADGRRLAFDVQQNNRELWVWENVLGVVKARRGAPDSR
jgi:Tol biopolymer transport system component